MKNLFTILAAIGIFILVAVILSLPTMWLWNWLMPTIFGLCKISVWQAMGINILAGILFRGFSKTNS